MSRHESYDYWLQRNAYYHTYLASLYRFSVPKGERVLQLGCKTGYLLHAVDPSYGVGVDHDEASIDVARTKYPEYSFFVGGIESVPQGQVFDYIVLSSVTMYVDDIQDLFLALHRVSHPGTRFIIDSYSYLWEPVLWIIQKLGLRRPTILKNWISPSDMQNLLRLGNCEIITHDKFMLIPCYIPLLSWFANSCLAFLPLINRLCLIDWVVARPRYAQSGAYSVSVIIPCRNERGNIEAAIQRTPNMGSWTEIIFVEGGSKDGTIEELQRVIVKYPDNKISYYIQTGKGKGDAVRLGFDRAQGDILMILDADLTTPPEEMPKFYDALTTGKGELINGSRLVYSMQSEAMRFLNLIANHLFAIGFSWVLSQRIKDTLCGTKVLFKKDYQKIVKGRSFFGEFDPFGDFDLIFGAAKQNLKIIDMPVHYKNRTYGETQIRRFYHGLILLRMSFIGFCKFKIRA